MRVAQRVEVSTVMPGAITQHQHVTAAAAAAVRLVERVVFCAESIMGSRHLNCALLDKPITVHVSLTEQSGAPLSD